MKRMYLMVLSLLLLFQISCAEESGSSGGGGGNNTMVEDTQGPTTPTNVQVSILDPGHVLITWDESMDNVGVVSYDIYRTHGACYQYAWVVDGTTTEYIDTQGLEASTGVIDCYHIESGVPYCYSLQSWDAANNRSIVSSGVCVLVTSNGDIIPPTAPTNLVAVGTSSTRIDLSWTPSTDNVGVVSYRVFLEGENTAYWLSYTNSCGCGNLQANTEYCFVVKAFDLVNNASEISNTACARTKP